MRKKVILAVLAILLVGWGVMLGLQKRTNHDAPAVAAAATASASASASGSAVAPPGSGSAVAPPGSSSAAASPSGDPDAGAPKLMDRPLRVASLGWDLAAPGLLANGGADPAQTSDFSAAGLEVHIAPTDSTSMLEAALARGGEDKDGADIAILPLPTFVASYERLRALSLDIFFVTGWSRGHDAVLAGKPEWPQKGEVKLAAAPGSPAAFVALFAFDLQGIPPSQVRLVAPSEPPAAAPFAAVDRSASPPREPMRDALLLTTADAPHLVPYVAVAPRGFIEQRSRALSAWASTWLAGARKLTRDPPAGARTVSSTKGAPEPISLLQTLGQSSPATLGDNVRAMGLSGRGGVTLDRLFQRSWALWRGVSLLATPAPDQAPISTGVVSSLARAEPSEAAGGDDDKPRDVGPSPRTLLTYRQPDGKLDDAAMVSAAGLLAGVFERAPLRLAVNAGGSVDKAKTKKLIDDATGRFGLAQGRILAATKAIPQSAGTIEVLAAP
ncbi:MAG: hypothetical protein U0441_32870 [Polyangiaceae bacterium]